MTCHLAERITQSRALWMFAIVATSTIVLGQTASAQYGYPQTAAFPSQSNYGPQAPPPRAYAPPPWQYNNTYAQGFAQPADPWRLPGPQTSAPEFGPVSYPNSQDRTQSAGTWYTPAPRADAYLSWPANVPATQMSPQPTSAPYGPTLHALAQSPQPVQYNYAQGTAEPTNWWQSPAPQAYAPQSSLVNFNYLQEPGGSDGASSRSSSRGGGPPQRSGRSREISGPFISTQTFRFWNDDLWIDGEAQVPVLGRTNVAEHNSPLPRDRAYFIYKNYSNVLNNRVFDLSGNPLGASSGGISQYLVGYERTFHDKRSSLELRMPFFSTGYSQFNAGFFANNPSIGNFAFIGKRVLYRDDQATVAAGCAVTLPTGDDTVFSLGPQTFTIENDTAHFVPFLGSFRQSRDESSFIMIFGGLDIPSRGNQIRFSDPVAGTQDLGRLVNQTLLYLDFTVGRWLYRNPCNDTLTGFAVQGEFHYAGTLNDANSLQGTVSGVGWNTGYNFGNTQNRFDSTFAALVLHAELQNQTDIRVAGVFPLNDANNRFFDAEFIVALTQRF